MRDLLLPLPEGARPRSVLEQRLREAIRSGRLVAGSPLPSTRSLSADLGIARSTVVAAYEQLGAEGYVLARQGRSTIVAEIVIPSAPVDDPNPLASTLQYDFRPGEPEAGSFPRAEWQRSTRRVLAQASDTAFGYGDPRGLAALRVGLASYLSRVRMVSVDSAAVRVFSGFAPSLGFIGEMLRRRGVDRMGVEQPMLPFHRQILELVGLQTVPIAVDGEGIQVADLVEAQVGAVMVTPSNHQPLGVALSPARRVDLVDWARATNAWIVEDDYDGEFRYGRKPIGALQGLAPEQVLYAGTASKALAPGVHLSWLVVPPGLQRDLAAVTHMRAGVSAIDQLILADMIERGVYDRHVRQQRRTYGHRRETLSAELDQLPWSAVAPSDAGMQLVVRITDPHIHESEVLAKANAASVGLTGLQTDFAHVDAGVIINVARPPAHRFATAKQHLLTVLRSIG